MRRQRRGAASERLRRLRLWLTVLFTVMNTVGLVLLGPLIVQLDEQSRLGSQEAELRRVTSSMARLIRVSSGNAIDFALLPTDPLYRACPRFAVVPGDEAFPTYRSAGDCVDLDDATLRRLTAEAIAGNRVLVAEARGPGGERLRVVVEPYSESGGGRPTGVVAAWSDFGEQAAAHRRVQLMVLAGCLVLVVGAAGAGYWLAGRATRPAAAALEQQEKLLADTAHDLRTPVAALRVYAENAARDPDQAREDLPRAVRLAGRMGDIIDGLLIRARLAAGVERLSMQPLMLDQLVSALVEDTPAAGANVSVITAPSQVMADKVLLQRAVGNLLDNALRYGREPGHQAVVTVTVADGRVTVADRGPGVDAELTDEEMFARFTSARGSSGLGLSIVRWVAEAHGGSLSVYNADEGGAIFEFRLPPMNGA
jgi:two-component system, OmpR family, sensor kinase